MNKLRLIKIYELKGKIHPIEQSVIDILDGIQEEPHLDYIFYKKDGWICFTYHLNNNNNISITFVVYSVFNNKFGLSYGEIKEIMKYLLEKHLKININEVYE